MVLKFINSSLETDDSSILFEGYNLSHRLASYVGMKFKFDSVGLVTDPTTGRNLDRVVMRPHDDSLLAQKLQNDLASEIKKIKAEYRLSAEENKKIVMESANAKILAAERRAEKARAETNAIIADKPIIIDNSKELIEEKTNEAFKKFQKEYQTKLKMANDMFTSDLRDLQKQVDRLTKENDVLKAAKSLEVIEVVDDAMNGSTEMIAVSSKKPKKTPKK